MLARFDRVLYVALYAMPPRRRLTRARRRQLVTWGWPT